MVFLSGVNVRCVRSLYTWKQLILQLLLASLFSSVVRDFGLLNYFNVKVDHFYFITFSKRGSRRTASSLWWSVKLCLYAFIKAINIIPYSNIRVFMSIIFHSVHIQSIHGVWYTCIVIKKCASVKIWSHSKYILSKALFFHSSTGHSFHKICVPENACLVCYHENFSTVT